MINTISKFQRGRGRCAQRGSAYVEYFLAAAAMAAATMAVWGSLDSVNFVPTRDAIMGGIQGDCRLVGSEVVC